MRPLLRIICAEHDRVIARVVKTDEGPAFESRFPMTALAAGRGGEIEEKLKLILLKEGAPADGPVSNDDLVFSLEGKRDRRLREVVVPGQTLLDDSEPRDEDEPPFLKARRGPFAGWCPSCRQFRGTLEVGYLKKTRGTIRV